MSSGTKILRYSGPNNGNFFTTLAPKSLWGGAVFCFGAKIGLKSTKNLLFCILFRPMGEGSSPSWLRYLFYASWSSSNAFVSGTGGLRFKSRAVKSDTVVPTARHRCDISWKGAVLPGRNDAEIARTQ